MKQLLQILASLKLSIVLLALAMLLVYTGTWAQVDQSAYQVQKTFFHSWIAPVPFSALVPWLRIPVVFPLPGGYLLGLAMLVNLLANWFTRFKWTWKHAGIHLVHLGIVLLLLGEAWTSTHTQEAFLLLQEGQTKSYTEDQRRLEIALIDRSPADADQVWSVAHEQIRTGNTVADSDLPVTFRVVEYAQNANILGPMQTDRRDRAKATAGAGVGASMIPLPPVGGTTTERDVPAAFVQVMEGQKDLGTYLLAPDWPMLAAPQTVKLSDGREFGLQLRFRRYYKPYQITLKDFVQEMYPGTDKPKAFESHIRLVDRERGVDREEKIWMNHPLRYLGETFYQSGAPAPDTTVLSVVRNPAYTMPYIACAVGSLGMIVQFGIGLTRFLKRREGTPRGAVKDEGPIPVAAVAAGDGRSSLAAVGVPAALLLVSVLCIVGWASVSQVAPYELAQVPVYFDGRLQPLDTLARNTLRTMNGKTSVKDEQGNRLTPTQWLLNAICRPKDGDEVPMVLIENPELAASLGLEVKEGRKRFSLAELGAKQELIQRQVSQALEVPEKHRDLLQRQMLELAGKLNAYSQAAFWQGLFLAPPATENGPWRAMGQTLDESEAAHQRPDRIVETIATALMQYQQTPSMSPTATTVDWLSTIESAHPTEMSKIRLEVFYNRFEPFLVAMVMYVLVFLLACASMLLWRVPLGRSAMVLALAAFALHTAALAIRMYVQGRPPVTNLYSSAIFIGWGTVLLALVVEWIYRNGITLAMGALVSTGTLIVAQNLAQGGDTMESLRAVLDSNFWLTTHVLAITLGYSVVFLAGGLGIAYVVAAIFATDWFDSARRESLSRMIYGVSCFALLFSFVGTVLGGIWADQSWGRFWGWDPKENGAVLIVIWLAILLHARWVGARGRGLALLAIFGNIVTAWSWFGTNLMGVGLHSYGFMAGAMYSLLAYVVSQLLIIGLGWFLIPAEGGAQTAEPLAVAEAE